MLTHETKGGHVVVIQAVTPQDLYKALVVVDLNTGSVLDGMR